MTIFATEFPVNPDLTKATFVAATVAWIRGIKKSTVLDKMQTQRLEDDEVFLEASSGETLAIKTYEDNATLAYGVRHELPDENGLIWRTECVYTNLGASSFLRVRGQCVAAEAGAEASTPLKPYFISQAVEDGWSAEDGYLTVQNTPHYLEASDLDFAVDILGGLGTEFLPIIYVSRNNNNSLPLNEHNLARKMAGIAHVVVEPDRSFSFSLMEKIEKRNPYGGAVGLVVPLVGQRARFFKRSGDIKGLSLEATCVGAVNRYVSLLDAKKGWEWQNLQEAQSRRLREVAISNTAEDLTSYINVFDAEVKAKDETIESLKLRLEVATSQSELNSMEASELVAIGLASRIGDELYDGEFSDRLRSFLVRTLNGELDSVHPRTIKLVEKFIDETEFTGRAGSEIHAIKQMGRDGKDMPRKVGKFFDQHGYSKSQDGKHWKYSPPESLFGLANEALPCTPSDGARGGRNRVSDLIRSLGLSELK